MDFVQFKLSNKPPPGNGWVWTGKVCIVVIRACARWLSWGIHHQKKTGLVTAQASITDWIVATTPVFMAALGWLVLNESLDWWRVIGIALARAGVLLVVTHGDLVSLTLGRFGTPGDILILISAVNWAVFLVLSRRGLRRHPPARMILSSWVSDRCYPQSCFSRGQDRERLRRSREMLGWGWDFSVFSVLGWRTSFGTTP